MISGFKDRYLILDQVRIELVNKDDHCMKETIKGMPFSLIAIMEGGVRFPLHHFLLNFLLHHNISPSQAHSNVYRIVMGTLELDCIFGVNLGIAELNYCYTLCKVGGDSYKLYLRAADKIGK